MADKSKKDVTVGQVRRASDSRPRPGSGTPSSEPSAKSEKAAAPTSKTNPKPFK